MEWCRRLGLFVECVLTAVVVVCLAGCSNPGHPPNPLPTPVGSPVVPSGVASASPSGEEVDLRKAERAVHRFWRVIDRLSADPDSNSDGANDGFPGLGGRPVGQEHQSDRYDRVRSTGNVVVRDAMAKRSKKRDMFRVTACMTRAESV